MSEFIASNDAIDEDLLSYRNLENKISELTAQRDLLERKIIDSMKGSQGIMSSLGKITYTTSLRATTNWKSLSEEALIPDSLIEKHTKKKEVYTFRTLWSKE